MGTNVKIRPKVAMFSAFARLNYRPWFALAEFVDNSLQSFIAEREAIQAVDGITAKLTVRILLEEDRIVVEDTAAGISADDFSRAFMPAQPPPNRTGLSEFGLGMKAAACWFARRWSVRTCALGEGIERTLNFNVPEIVAQDIEEIIPEEHTGVAESAHYTTIVLDDLNRRIKGPTIGKIKSHLASIYRAFIAEGILSLCVGGEELTYSRPNVLEMPYCKTPDDPPIVWQKKHLRIEIDDSHRVHGWAALRAKASVAEAGFAVFRRGRVVLGSGETPYRPEKIFRGPNSYTYQRLFGELHVEGFDVSHTKDGLLWDEWEELLLDELKKQLDAEPMPLLAQAEGYRVRGKNKADENLSFGDEAATHTAAAIKTHAGAVVSAQLGFEPEPEVAPLPQLPETKITTRREITLEIEHDGRTWLIAIELASDPGVEDWYSYSKRQQAETGITEVTIRLSMSHPFTERFGLKDGEQIEPLMRIASALALAEITALEVGISPRIKTLRRNFNQLLRQALAK